MSVCSSSGGKHRTGPAAAQRHPPARACTAAAAAAGARSTALCLVCLSCTRLLLLLLLNELRKVGHPVRVQREQRVVRRRVSKQLLALRDQCFPKSLARLHTHHAP